MVPPPTLRLKAAPLTESVSSTRYSYRWHGLGVIRRGEAFVADQPRYSRQFKEQAVELLLGSGDTRPVAEVAREVGVSPATLRRWAHGYSAERDPTGGLQAEERQRLHQQRYVTA